MISTQDSEEYVLDLNQTIISNIFWIIWGMLSIVVFVQTIKINAILINSEMLPFVTVFTLMAFCAMIREMPSFTPIYKRRKKGCNYE